MEAVKMVISKALWLEHQAMDDEKPLAQLRYAVVAGESLCPVQDIAREWVCGSSCFLLTSVD